MITGNRLVRVLLMAGVPAAAALAGIMFYFSGGGVVSVEDAYVQAARVAISADVPGRVVELAVSDNQAVQAGQVLFKLDERPYRIAVASAEAQLAESLLKIEAEKATLRQKRADLQAAEDTLSYRKTEFERQQRLLTSGIASQSQYDQAANGLQVARQQVAALSHDIAAVMADLGGEPDRPPEQHPRVQLAQAAVDRARLNLSYTIIAAPEAGIVTKVEQLQVGDYVNTSQPLFSLVSATRLWIEANVKETDLTHMRAGQKATVMVDAYPGRPLTARVASLSPGTGSAFSLLPPENATGNWVKVVQRLPVRLQVDGDPAEMPLRAGLSVTVDIETGYRRSLSSLFGGP